LAKSSVLELPFRQKISIMPKDLDCRGVVMKGNEEIVHGLWAQKQVCACGRGVSHRVGEQFWQAEPVSIDDG
jgi:hypothetical protein